MTISSIKTWPVQERPRERLLKQGAHSLSDAELLAIFLRSGSKQHSAVELARQLIQHYGGLNPIFDSNLNDLTDFHGIGQTKYAQLMAVKELGRRYIENQYSIEKQNFDCTHKVIDFLRYQLQGEKEEVFAVLCLNANLELIEFKKLFFGSTHQCHVLVNQLMRYVLNKQAVQIIITHNHPTGHATPSEADIELTRTIQNACQLLEVHLIDHCIISPIGSFSFAEKNLLTRL